MFFFNNTTTRTTRTTAVFHEWWIDDRADSLCLSLEMMTTRFLQLMTPSLEAPPVLWRFLRTSWVTWLKSELPYAYMRAISSKKDSCDDNHPLDALSLLSISLLPTHPQIANCRGLVNLPQFSGSSLSLSPLRLNVCNCHFSVTKPIIISIA